MSEVGTKDRLGVIRRERLVTPWSAETVRTGFRLGEFPSRGPPAP
jgi:hypothetical protein